jgi:hypothetical protein
VALVSVPGVAAGDTEKWRQLYQHEMAAVSEGLCPVHGTPLEPWAAPPRKIAGHCAACRRYWGFNRDSQEVGWWLDHNPATGWPSVRVPDFMAWREDP